MKLCETVEQYKALIKDTQGLLVVDFYADWCGPCRMISPKLELMEEEISDLTIIKVNVDDNPDVAENEEVSAMPTFVFYKEGAKVATFVGANAEKIKALILEHV